MDWFKKKREVLDLTDMQKRGIFNPKLDNEINESDVLDLSNIGKNSQSISEKSFDNSNFSFLGNLAGAGESSDSSNSISNKSNSYTKELRRVRESYGTENHLKTKIEDIEYKIERLIERIEKLESRFGILGVNRRA